MLQLRAFASPGVVAAGGERLRETEGVRHLAIGAATVEGTEMLTADIAPTAVEPVLALLRDAGFRADDVTVWRATSIQPLGWHRRAGVAQDDTSWTEIAGRAAVSARLAGTYLLYMATAGVVAGIGVITDSSILIVGAMALSPDLLPIAAAAVGVVERRWRLMARSAVTLVAGLAVASVAAMVATLLLRVTGRIDADLDLSSTLLGPTLTELGPGSLLVATAAGVAGMLAYETVGSAAVGVAISVTTIPAAAYLGVAVALPSGGAPDALVVLCTNVVTILVASTITLLVQRWRAGRRVGDEGAPSPAR